MYKNNGHNTEFNKFLNRKIYYNEKSKKILYNFMISNNHSKGKKMHIVEKIINIYLWKYNELSIKMKTAYFSKISERSPNNDSHSIDYVLLNKIYVELCHSHNIPENILNQERGNNRVKSIQKYIDLRFPVSCYLDIGCFDGHITKAIGNLFKLNKEQIHGTDIESPNSCIVNKSEFNFTIYDGIKLPYDDNYFDLITCLMVLHHIPEENLSSILAEINRVMKPGGVLILREHDVKDNDQVELLNVMHDFYDYVWTDNPIEKKEQWDTNYKDNIEWTNLLKTNKFSLRDTPKLYVGDKNPYATYMCSYIKDSDKN